jgi:uncharacterized protein DUF4349
MRPQARHALLALTLLTGCFESRRPAGEERERQGYDQPAADRGPAAAPMEGGVALAESKAADAGNSALPNAPFDPSVAGSMIIRVGTASIEIARLEPAIDQVRTLALRVSGFVGNSEIRSGASQVRTATIEIKVPAQRFDELVSGLKPIGSLEYVNITAQDVGEEFTDISARVANSHRLEQRLIDLLATRTGKLSDVLEIERELARVREEIERMEGRLRYLKAHVATSSLAVTVHEKAPVVAASGGSLGVIGRALETAWRNFVGFVASLIESLGWLAPLATLGFGGLWLVRRWRRPRG